MFIVVAVLGLATLDLFSAGIFAAAATAMLLRWGSSSLPAVAGAQAVLGPGIAVGSTAATVSTGAAALAALCAGQPGIGAVPFGLAAAVLVAGPAATTTSHLALRLGAALAGTLLALIVVRRVDASNRRRVGVAAAVVAVAAAALS